MPEVSIVIPALNEAANLAELLPQLWAQTLPPVEIVVADHHSRDRTVQVARQGGARLVEGGRPAQARNAGAACCRGQWLFFLDADTRLPDRRFLEGACRDLARQGLAAAVSDVRPYYQTQDKGHGRAWLRAWDGLLMGVQNQGQRAWLRLGFPVGTAQFMAVRREVFLDLGGFAPAAEPFEDSELLLRVHRRLPASHPGRSSVGVLDESIIALVSMRRFDVMGRFWFPLGLSLRATLLRYLLRRELPLPGYWDLNQQGRYGKAGYAADPQPLGEKTPPAC
jgi:glycosyltransferase involved in cell wall biosynthesis